MGDPGGRRDGGRGGSAASPTPVDLSGGKPDDEGGMVIGNHGGPNGRIFYTNDAPTDHGNPAWFHTLSYGLFPYYFEHEREGWVAEAVYVTDYSAVDYDLSTGRDGRTYISAPTAAGTFGDATEATYVMGSDVYGGMGPALIPFSADDDVRSFVAAHGGRTVGFDEITPVLVRQYTR